MINRTDLERAALSGDVLAASELAHLFDSGEGVDRDPAKAIEWYQFAAKLGSKGAAYILGCKYRDGADVKRDDAMALKWFESAAALGDAAAHIFLAMTYVDGLLGQVVDKDRARLHSELANECTAKEITSRREIRENRQKNGDE